MMLDIEKGLRFCWGYLWIFDLILELLSAPMNVRDHTSGRQSNGEEENEKLIVQSVIISDFELGHQLHSD